MARGAALAIYATLAAATIVAMAGGASAQNCNSSILMGFCSAAVNDGAPPSPPCCSIMRNQLPCYCRNTSYVGYLEKNNFLKALYLCRIPAPECEP